MNHLSYVKEKAKEKRRLLEAKEKRRLLKTKNALSDKERKRLDTIDNLLSYDACFANLPMELGMRILVYLGCSEEEAKAIYPDLVQEAMAHMKGKYILVDPEEL